MKNIKTYEIFTKKDIKKYVVFCHENKEYFIDNIIDIDFDVVVYLMLYKYDYDENDIVNTDVEDLKSEYKIDTYIQNVLFSSDNLDECKDFLKMYVNSKKYNL